MTSGCLNKIYLSWYRKCCARLYLKMLTLVFDCDCLLKNNNCNFNNGASTVLFEHVP